MVDEYGGSDRESGKKPPAPSSNSGAYGKLHRYTGGAKTPYEQKHSGGTKGPTREGHIKQSSDGSDY